MFHAELLSNSFLRYMSWKEGSNYLTFFEQFLKSNRVVAWVMSHDVFEALKSLSQHAWGGSLISILNVSPPKSLQVCLCLLRSHHGTHWKVDGQEHFHWGTPARQTETRFKKKIPRAAWFVFFVFFGSGCRKWNLFKTWACWHKINCWLPNTHNWWMTQHFWEMSGDQLTLVGCVIWGKRL